MRPFADGVRHAHGLEIVAQRLLLLRRGPLVHPEQPGVLALTDEVRRTHVGRQHGLLDELVRVIARARHDLLDATRLVANDLRFDRLEVDRTAHGARRQQGAVDIVQVQQIRHQRFAVLSLRTAGVLQDGRHLGVGEARMAEHHRRVELVGMDLAFGVDQHVAHHAQALDTRIERTQSVRELLRQHRDDTAREVDRSGAVIGIHVDRSAGLHIVAHVGNGHQQTPALAAAYLGRLAIHRIVEVARVLAVNGHQRHVPQVHPVAVIRWTDMIGQGTRLRQRRLRELVRDAVLAHRDLDLHAGIVNLAQHLLDPPHRLAIKGWRFGQFDHHHLARLGRACRTLGNQHVLAVALVLRRNEPDPAFLQQTTDDWCA